jgi:hypothetical protein
VARRRRRRRSVGAGRDVGVDMDVLVVLWLLHHVQKGAEVT